MASTPLISTTELHARLAEPALRIVDCRFDLAQPQAGAEAYQRSRIPGAQYAHLDHDLSDACQLTTRGRHPLPHPQAFADWLARAGIDSGSQVVVYDQDQGMYAARLWWLLRASGHATVQLLDGGFRAWVDAGHALETGAPISARPLPAGGPMAPDREQWVDADQVRAGLQQGELLLLDARAAPRFRGEVEPIDPVAGHVPGARNRPYSDNLDQSGRFKPAAQLRAEFNELLAGHPPGAVVHMCGSGVTACHNLVAMAHAGLEGSRLYADSWSGWILDPMRPVALGPQ